MKQSKAINYPGPASEALKQAASYMTSKHQYEVTHSSDYSITFNKVRRFGIMQLTDFHRAAYNETATLVATEVSADETQLSIGGSNWTARTDLKQTVDRMVAQRSEQPDEAPLLDVQMNFRELLYVYSGANAHLEVRTNSGAVLRSLDASDIGSAVLGKKLTVTDSSGALFVEGTPWKGKKALGAIESIRTVNA